MYKMLFSNPSHFVGRLSDEKLSAAHGEIGKSTTTTVLPVLAVLTFLVGLVAGVLFTTTVQDENKQYNDALVNGLKKEVFIQKEQVKLSGLLIKLAQSPRDQALVATAMVSLNKLSRVADISVITTGEDYTVIDIKGRFFRLPFVWNTPAHTRNR
ncbi:MAG: hypothetical protein CSA50_01745 [Gammaproteobacteria bacterium]|nr:MAG: hypothetical protein CSA50_01745 [Gammaproteobacteria bacterium]